MDANPILVAEGLAVRMNTHQGKHGGVERIDALEGGTAVRCLAVEGDLLRREAEAGAAEQKLGLGRPCLGMDHHGDINIVKGTEADQLLLSCKKLYLPVLL